MLDLVLMEFLEVDLLASFSFFLPPLLLVYCFISPCLSSYLDEFSDFCLCMECVGREVLERKEKMSLFSSLHTMASFLSFLLSFGRACAR